jgi:predicted nuclease with TOPRIM domain
MKKIVLLLVVLITFIGLSAQQVQQQTGGRAKQKVDWEKEYLEMEKKYNAAQTRLDNLSKQHELIQKEKNELDVKLRNYSAIDSENTKLKKENSSLLEENKRLTEENNKMRAELENLKKGGKVKELKRID